MAKYNAGQISEIQHLLKNHELAGNFITFLGIGFSFFLIFMKLKFPKKPLNQLRRLIFLLMFGIVIYTGYLGGTLVQEFGAGVKPVIEKNK